MILPGTAAGASGEARDGAEPVVWDPAESAGDSGACVETYGFSNSELERILF